MGLKFTTFKTIDQIPKKNVKKFLKFLNKTNIAVCVWDDNAILRFINRAYYDLLGVPTDQSLLNKTTKEIKESQNSIYAPYQPFYKKNVLELLQEVNNEVIKNHTTEIIFSYQHHKPHLYQTLHKISLKRIKIGGQLLTLIWCIKLRDTPLKNPLLLKDKEEVVDVVDEEMEKKEKNKNKNKNKKEKENKSKNKKEKENKSKNKKKKKKKKKKKIWSKKKRKNKKIKTLTQKTNKKNKNQKNHKSGIYFKEDSPVSSYLREGLDTRRKKLNMNYNNKQKENINYRFIVVNNNDSKSSESDLENILPPKKIIDQIFNDYESSPNSSRSDQIKELTMSDLHQK
ncbi:hypothetical protein M0813_19827 [Anaeramoeba flamelloides]|uniref:PAS domain-containing protein n=1 Tax=Anaeramoeba flamelloides TaxID=1746091 RepID=A0ABQ8YN83_9EUKA|nr:hypothetical protein M0813_19827 [Anaeramoeba flamelloides]